MAKNASALEVTTREAKGVDKLPPNTVKDKPAKAKGGKAKDKPAPKAKEEKAKAAPKPKEDKAPSTRGGYAPTATITVLQYGGKGENPHKANGEGGGIRYLAWESCKRAKTVADYTGKPKYLKRWEDAGFIKISR